MYTPQAYYQQIFVFKNWTGKSYAVFNSLKKQITISELRFEIRSVFTEIKKALALILNIEIEENKLLTELLVTNSIDTEYNNRTNHYKLNRS